MELEYMVGKRFGSLIVVEYSGVDKHHHKMWKCKCDCGNFTIVIGSRLKNGKVLMCGCHWKGKINGLSKSRLYRTWFNMKARCEDKNSISYKDYGERGIIVCDEWLYNFQAFYEWAMANGYQDDLTIDRIDNEGNYEPSNCRWVTKKMQTMNRRNTVMVEFRGNVKTLNEWSEQLNIPYWVLYQRINYQKWDIQKSFNTPYKSHKPHKNRERIS